MDELIETDEAESERIEYEVTQSDFEMFGGCSDFIEGYAPRRSRRRQRTYPRTSDLPIRVLTRASTACR